MSGDSPIPGTALPQGTVDDEGADEARAFHVQVRTFGYIGLFMFVVSVGYGIWTQEPAGSAMLALAGGLATITAAYLGWPKHAHGAPAAGDETPWFPGPTIWPFAVGVAMFLFANGVLLGVWLLLPASAVLFAAVVGFVAQSRRRG